MTSMTATLFWLLAIATDLCCARGLNVTDLTIALIGNNQECNAANAPTLHITALWDQDTCIDISALREDPGLNLSLSSSIANWTVSNAGNYDNSTLYSQLWYQQLSGNASQNVENNTLGTFAVRTSPFNNCNTSGDYAETGSIQGTASGGPYLKPDEFLQWDCYAKGACYYTPYNIKSILVLGVFGGVGQLGVNGSEQNNKCELAAVSSTNYTNNNNTSSGKSAAVALGYPVFSTWATVGAIAILLVWA